MVKLTIKNENKIIEVEKGSNLLETLINNSIFVENPCNGNGTCGKCKVKIKSITNENKNELENISSSERKHLNEDEVKDGIRLSCFYNVNEDIEVELIKKEIKGKVLTEGYLPNFEKDSFNKGYGIAVDIGTTTVVCELVDLKSARVIGISSMVNPQKQYGLDVLTRITYEYEKEEKAIKELQDCIVSGLNELILELVQSSKIQIGEIEEIVVGANTTMLHLLLGVDARSLGKFPYKPSFVESKNIKANSIGLNVEEHTMLYTLPNVSAFIGSDIVAGAYVCELQKKRAMFYLLILEQMVK